MVALDNSSFANLVRISKKKCLYMYNCCMIPDVRNYVKEVIMGMIEVHAEVSLNFYWTFVIKGEKFKKKMFFRSELGPMPHVKQKSFLWVWLSKYFCGHASFDSGRGFVI